MGKKEVQSLITDFIGKYKLIKKDELNSTKDTHYEAESTVSQIPVKIEENRLKIDSKVLDVNILPLNNNQIARSNNQEQVVKRFGQILLTQMGFKTTGNQRPFHSICAECGLKLKTEKSKKLGFGPCCFKRHLARKQNK